MYTVKGYDAELVEFEGTFDSFMKALKVFRELIMDCTVIMFREEPGTCIHVM